MMRWMQALGPTLISPDMATRALVMRAMALLRRALVQVLLTKPPRKRSEQKCR
jgi:hypothetical protein